MFHALFAIISGNRKLKRYLKECRLPEDAGRVDVFLHEGCWYDREKFVELVRPDFSRLTVKEQVLEVKALAEGLERSVHPELDRAYIEAFRRNLENVPELQSEK